MPRPPQDNLSFVDPDAPSSDAGLDMARRLLIGGGCHPDDAAWLAPLLLDTLPSTQNARAALSEDTETHLGILALAWHLSEGDRNAAFMILLASLSNCIHIPRIIARRSAEFGDTEVWAMPDDAGERVVAEFRAHGIDFNHVLSQGWPKHIRDEWARDNGAGVRDRYASFFRLLLRTGAVDLPRLIDLRPMREFGRRGSWYPVSFSMSAVGVEWQDGVSWLDPHSLRVWAWFTGPAAFRAFLPAFVSEPAETLRALSYAVAQTAATWVGRPGHGRHFEDFDAAGADFAQAMRPYFDHLDACHRAPEAAEALHEPWMLYFRMAWDAEVGACPTPLQKRMMEQATEDLAKMRKIFAAATAEGDTEQARAFTKQLSHFTVCSTVLARHGGIWKSMKALLLALRAMGTRAVAMDLRYWDEFVQDPPPQPWCAIPATMINLFHFNAGREQQNDPELKGLRTELALFLLDKLTDKWSQKERDEAEAGGRVRTDEDMKEPMWMWRYCAVRAVLDLQIDPEGRGHKALRWSADHDPHPKVRDEARRGHDVLRHTRSLPAGTSPRRTVLAAIWWYRQGHLLGLGFQPDADRARRTRKNELTRTKEPGRDDEPAAD